MPAASIPIKYPRLLALMAGAASVLSMAPFFQWPVLWLTLPAMLHLMSLAEAEAPAPSRIAPWRKWPAGRAAEIGWCFGFGFHAAGLFWIGEAFLVEAEVFAWLLPFAVTLMPAGLALFTALLAAGTSLAGGASPITRLVAFALFWGVTEWLRGHILTGFPWNVLGYALTYPDALMQAASLLGIYGLTIIAVLMFAGPWVLWHTDGGYDRVLRVAAVGLAILPILAMATWGAWRLSTNPIATASSAPIIRIVQPSVPQREKWRPENQRRIFDEHLELSHTSPSGVNDAAANVAVIVWPEAAMPFLPLEQPIALTEIGRMLAPPTILVTGALRAEQSPSGRRVYNSLLVFGSGDNARHLASYDKTHLVPFGEYLPLQGWLEAVGLQQLSRLRGGFASGPEPRPLIDIPGVGPFGPLICYEALFPGRIVQSVQRPIALVNVTNDGWFGNTTGPRQHFHMSRVRAVEEGLPIVRAANNGISALIDPLGRVVGRLDMNVRGTFDTVLPGRIAPPLYARHPDLLFALLIVVLVIILLAYLTPIRKRIYGADR